MSRPASFFSTAHQAVVHHEIVARRRIRQLRAFYFTVAASERSSSNPEATEPAVSHFDFVEDLTDPPNLHDLCIDNYSDWIRSSSSGWHSHGISLSFVELLVGWMVDHSGESHGVYPLSFIELVFLYCQKEDAAFPFLGFQNRII